MRKYVIIYKGGHMMNRDYGKEIDGLKEQIEMLKDLLSKL